MTRLLPLRITPAALEETEEAARWYEQRRSGLGIELLAAVDAAMRRIARDPQRFGR